MWMYGSALITLAVLYAIKKVVAYRRAILSVGGVPGYRVIVNSNDIPGFLLPKIEGFCQGRNYALDDKHTVFERAGCDIISHIGFFPSRPDIVLADAAAIKEVTINRARFPKPVELYGTLSFFGFNIVASEGEEWKRYRKITAPTFSDRNNVLVWEQTVATMNDLFDNAWGNKDVVTVDNGLDITLPIALFVISGAGFGRRMSWTEDTKIPPGHQMTFKTSMTLVLRHIMFKIMLPNWAMKVTAKGREVDLAFKELQTYMTEMVQERVTSDKVERRDLFSSLLEANTESGAEALTDEELVGNIFIYLLAGHETTAHTLCYALALLALYPDEQEKLYQQIKSVARNPLEPTYEEIPSMTRTAAVFNETLRMFPPVPLIPKKAAEDTTLKTTNRHGETVIVPIPAGTPIAINAPGLHYNPKYWEDPETFKPDRFLKPDWNRDAFVPFSAGARACLGRKFGEVEGAMVLSMFVSRYKVTIKEEPQFTHETFGQRKARVLKSVPTLTLRPIKASLTFTRRK